MIFVSPAMVKHTFSDRMKKSDIGPMGSYVFNIEGLPGSPDFTGRSHCRQTQDSVLKTRVLPVFFVRNNYTCKAGSLYHNVWYIS